MRFIVVILLSIFSLIHSSPSINLFWAVNEPVHAVAVEVEVQEDYTNTYYCAVGFHSGYSGFQSNSALHFFKYKMMLFSIWNKGDNFPKFIANNNQVYRTTFGGEGEGLSLRSDTKQGKTFADWQVKKKYIFLVRAYYSNGGSNIDLYISKNGLGFQYFGTFWEKSTSPGYIRAPYSFIEDFTHNNGKRAATYRAFMKKQLGGTWEGINSVYANSQTGNHKIEIGNTSEGDVVSITSGGNENIGGGRLNLNPGKIPDALEQFPY